MCIYVYTYTFVYQTQCRYVLNVLYTYVLVICIFVGGGLIYIETTPACGSLCALGCTHVLLSAPDSKLAKQGGHRKA